MRWVLPGEAVLVESNRKGREREVACRPQAAVLVRTRTRGLFSRILWRFGVSRKWLVTVKLVLEVLVLLVTLIGGILALLGLSRK